MIKTGREMMVRSLIALIFIFHAMTVFGQVSFIGALNKSSVALQGNFEVTYRIEKGTPTSFTPPNLKDFYVLNGPNQFSSSQMRNGRVTQTISISYVLQPKKEGKLVIMPARCIVNGKTYKSNSLTINVTKQAKDQISEKIFLRLEVDKSTVYQGEQLIATYKIYTRLPIVNYTLNKLPAFTGFWSQDIDIPRHIQLKKEVRGGVQYDVGIIKKVALFPQRSGELDIESMEMETIVRIKDNSRRSRSLYESLFGRTKDVKRVLASHSVKIKVKPFPSTNKPSMFGGACGKFKMEVNIDKTETKAEDPITLRIKISGQGNIKLIDVPKLILPSQFEVYDPKISEYVSKSSQIINGRKTYEYLIIPRLPGEYKIPALHFAYFDLARNDYTVTSSPEFVINVLKGDGTPTSSIPAGITKEDVELIGQDIRFIKTGPVNLAVKGYAFYGSTPFVMMLFLPISLFILLIIWLKRQEKLSGNIVLMKNRRANKMAKKRLAKAAVHLKENDSKGFYDETARAIWGYLGDKLNISTADLTKDKAREILSQKNIEDVIIDQLLTTLDNCEMALFAPTEAQQTMDTVYNDTV
ncbi:MAG: protein BatD, partial [Bacteroidetes bacterium]|nr:protein BatD [Bacteroidota bacterium]